MKTTTRNATLEDLAGLLKEQHARKHDVVAPATAISSSNATLMIEGTDIEPDPSAGFTTKAAPFVPTVVADEGLADKLGIPVPYLRKLRQHRPDLYDANVNGWLHGHRVGEGALLVGGTPHNYEPDDRKFLVRTFRGEDGPGIARAFLSDGYKIIDNLDVLTAALEGVREAGVNVNIDGCDLSERRMYVRIVSPDLVAMAPTLLKGYRSPFQNGAQRAGETDLQRATGHEGYDPGSEPIVFGGFVISNSEVGNGAFSIVPRLVVQVCRNGLTITRDATRAIHLGSKLDEGVIRWSEDTQEKNLQLVAAQARDAVATFLDRDYMTRVIERLEEKAGKPLENPAEQVKLIGQQLRFGEERTNGVLDHFIRGGQVNAGGVLNAVTSFAQTLDDADDAFEFEAQAMRAFEAALAQ